VAVGVGGGVGVGVGVGGTGVVDGKGGSDIGFSLGAATADTGVIATFTSAATDSAITISRIVFIFMLPRVPRLNPGGS